MEDQADESFNLTQLRNLVRQYIDNQLYTSANFWADKVCTLSNYDSHDTLWLAHTMFLTKQFTRAAHLLKSRGLTQENGNARYLAAKCYYECKEWRVALETLEGNCTEPKLNRLSNGFDDGFFKIPQMSGSSPCVLTGGRKIESATALLKGMLYEMLDNKNLAVQSYKEALFYDVYCFEAFNLLVSHHTLTADEENQLLASLPVAEQCSPQEAKLLKFVYEAKIMKYAKPVDAKIPLSLEPLNDNLDFVSCVAERHFNNCNYKEAYKYITAIIKKDPLHADTLPLLISCLVHQKAQNELYSWANKLVNTYPERAVTWFAVGSYYLLINKNELARKFFSKSTGIDNNFGPAWLGFAHSFAVEGEHDQAISAYYSASKLMPGSHLPYLYLGLEYALSNNTKLAFKFYREALTISPDDPHIKHELGSMMYQNGEYEQAKIMLESALKRLESLGQENELEAWELLFNNLGHVHRKMKLYEQSISYHQRALSLNPKNAGTYSAIGLCYMMQDQYDHAIHMFHKSLSLKRDDTVTAQMLSQALECLSDVDVSVESVDTLTDQEDWDLTSQNESSLHSSTGLDNPSSSAAKIKWENNSSVHMEDVCNLSNDMSLSTP